MNSTMFEKLREQDPNRYPARMGQSWSNEELNKAYSSIRNGKDIKQIAQEHERTIGSIVAIQKKMVMELYNNNKNINEIEKLTFLPKEDIEYIIMNYNKPKPKKETNDMKELLILVSEIQTKLAILTEKITKQMK